MTTTTRPIDPFPEAASLVRERVLVRGTSLCRTRHRLWRDPNLADLLGRLRGAAAAGEGGLHDRWHGALRSADAEVVQLAAEALAVHLLIAADIRPGTKRAQIDATLAHRDRPPPLPAVIDTALEHGPTPTGVAFKRRRLSQITFLLAAVQTWRALPAAVRRTNLGEPWEFRAWLRTVPVDGAQAQHQALLHLAHPETFEPITSAEAKRRIVAALGLAAERDLDTDEALLAIRGRLSSRHGDGFSFGAAPLRDRWLR